MEYETAVPVDTAPFPQDVTCPGCAHTWRELISEKTAGVSCPECDIMIEFKKRDRPTRDLPETEQTALADIDRNEEVE